MSENYNSIPSQKMLIDSKPYLYSFARYILKNRGIQLKRGDEFVFDFRNPHIKNFVNESPPRGWDTTPITPYFIARNLDMPELGEFSMSITLQQLNNLGMTITETNNNMKSYRKKKSYTIKRKGNNNSDQKIKLPPKTRIDYDAPHGFVRLVGDFFSEWIPLHSQEKFIKNNTTDYSDVPTQSMIDVLNGNSDTLVIPPKKFFIKNNLLPVGLNYYDRSLVCIPKSNDTPRIGLVGTPGRGKTLLIHALCDMLYWHWNTPFCLINDYKGETDSWCNPTGFDIGGSINYKQEKYGQPVKDGEFINRLSLIGLRPRSLPVVWLYPSMQHGYDSVFHEQENVSSMMTLSWEFFMTHYNDFTRGLDDFDLKGGDKYITREGIGAVKSHQELLDYIDGIASAESKEVRKRLDTMRFRMKNVFQAFIDKKLFDISTGIPSGVKVLHHGRELYAEEYSLPFACMVAGLCPSIQTKKLESVQIGTSNMMPAYLNYIIKDIFDKKVGNQKFKKEPMYIVADEVGVIMRKGVSTPLIDVATLGRSEGLGLIWANQSYDIIQEVRNYTDYLFMLGVNSQDERSSIARDFGVDDNIKEAFKDINRKRNFEAWLLHQKPVYSISMDTGVMRKVDYEPLRITCIAPQSKHKKPLE